MGRVEPLRKSNTVAGGCHGWARFLCIWHTSVVPFALKLAIPCALLAALFAHLERIECSGWAKVHRYFHVEPAAYTSFFTLLGFLMVFRTSQAYQRYWNGAELLHVMCAWFLDSATSLLSYSTAAEQAQRANVMQFRHTIVRLFSLLMALCILDLQGGDKDTRRSCISRLQVIGAESFSAEAMRALHGSQSKILTVNFWIQSEILANMAGAISVPAPILTRSLQSLSNGMMAHNDCRKSSLIPFPFPYTQATMWLLWLHWLLTPFVFATWAVRPVMAALFTFISVFIFWTMFIISEELENPFGQDDSDLDCVALFHDMNASLCQVFTNSACSTPILRPEALSNEALFGQLPESHAILSDFCGSMGLDGSDSESDDERSEWSVGSVVGGAHGLAKQAVLVPTAVRRSAGAADVALWTGE